jgi:hypothetical protein
MMITCWARKGHDTLLSLSCRTGLSGTRWYKCTESNPDTRKSDAIDAVRAAWEALSSEHLIHPRNRGQREALRVLMSTRVINHLKDLIVSASEDLRAQLRHMTSDAQISYCAALRTRPTRDLAHRTTTRELQCTAQRVLALCTEANELQAEQRINPACPTLSLQLQRFRPQDRGSANARPYTSTPAARSPPESSVHCPRRDVCEVRLPVPGWLRFNPFTS